MASVARLHEVIRPLAFLQPVGRILRKLIRLSVLSNSSMTMRMSVSASSKLSATNSTLMPEKTPSDFFKIFFATFLDDDSGQPDLG